MREFVRVRQCAVRLPTGKNGSRRTDGVKVAEASAIPLYRGPRFPLLAGRNWGLLYLPR